MDITTSAIRCARKCLRLYRYKYVDQVRPTVDAQALAIGKLVHTGVEAFCAGLPLDVAIGNMEISKVGDLFWRGSAQAPKAGAQSAAMVTGYFNKWLPEREKLNPVWIEKEFAVPFGRHVLKGKIDLVYRTPTGGLCVRDTKTTSDDVADPSSPFWLRLPMDLQLTQYAHAIEIITGERPQLWFDVIKKPTIQKKKSEDWQGYQDRATALYLENPDKWFFQRRFTVLRGDSDEILDESIATANALEEEEVYPRNDYACMQFGQACNYMGVCTGTESLDNPKFKKLQTPFPELGDTDK